MQEIKLTRGFVCLVDDEDYEYLSKFKWHTNSNGYACRYANSPISVRGWSMIGMHRELLGLSFGDKRMVDHINGNRLDNRRSNIRIALPAENIRNRGKQSNNKSGFKGVHLNARSQRWYAQICINKKRIYLGEYKTPEEAHAAYCIAAKKFHGEFANTGEPA